MKLFPRIPRKPAGSALLISLITSAILGTIAGSFLYLTQYQVTVVSRSQSWNTAMVAAEAGMEEGLSTINRYANIGIQLTDWPQVAVANGWTDLGNNVYLMRRTLDGTNAYRVYITNLNNAPVIKTIGYSYFPTSGKHLVRAVAANNAAGSLFLGGVLAKRSVNINGGADFDSFNSQDPNYSTGGQYDHDKRKDGGNIGSVQSNVVAVIQDSGNTKINGQVATGPNSTISVAGNAVVGSFAWVANQANKGKIQPGWSRNDLNIVIPDAPPLPTASYGALPNEGSVVLNAKGGTVYYMTPNTYHMVSSDYLLITNGTAVIDFRAGIKMDAQTAIRISPGSRLIMYLGTENSQLDGQGVVNPSGFATNCIVYGKNNCNQIEINGGSAFIGYVYAPYADVTLNGNSDIIGAMVGDTFQINGNMKFHYDESLGGPQSGSSIYRILAWRELSPSELSPAELTP